MSNKVTAVEWLFNDYVDKGVITIQAIEQALEMEKEQIETAYNAKKVNYYPHNDLDISAEQYYTETYEQ